MLVYGSPSQVWALRDLVTRLQAEVRALRRAPAPPAASELRALLIYTGQLEQGVTDALGDDRRPSTPAVSLSRTATTVAAAAWYHGGVRAQAELATCESALAELSQHEEGQLCIRVPEGYAYHGLYPEQYIDAAHAWARAHAPEPNGYTLVVGLRTIGTSMTAAVAAALNACGYATVTTTLRPSGHPYARTASIDGRLVHDARAALIVDEGPGRSGSSMAAAAHALVEAGLPRGRIAFLPSHAGEPGPEAAEDIRAWWRETPRYVAASWSGKDTGLIAGLVTPFVGDDIIERVDDIGGGLWRHHAYGDETQWPAVCAAFEAPKFLYTMRSGRQWLAKFAGLNLVGPNVRSAAQYAAQQMQRTAELGMGLMPCGVAEGFIITPWLQGRRITPHDANAHVLAELGRHVALSVGKQLSSQEYEAALMRLRDIVLRNVALMLSADDVATAQRSVERALPDLLRRPPPRASGDGHMAPHEWIRTHAEGLCKTDNAGTTLDGTYIDMQADSWDLAGIAVEWGLQDEAYTKVLQAYRAAGGATHSDVELNLHRLAYAAFRAGQCALGMDVDTTERDRLTHALARYRDECIRRLSLT